MRKQKFLAFIFIVTLSCLVQAELSLGNVALGDKYVKVIAKYAFPQQFTDLERGQLPYPLNLEASRGAYIAQAKRRNIECYFDDAQQVIAVSAFLSDDKDVSLYETDKGLRLMDSLIELKMLYGTPTDISEYTYKDLAFREPVTRRIYYYPNLCVQTRQYGEMAEVIDALLVGRYIPEIIVQKKDTRIKSRNI